ncbi:MAG TPA: maleylpyruvate isomerase N-terminal domain-containing protein [bacterium]|nr:maleylpyruvate isomerase N-terminal domain-containing protein [bacterium]
MADRHMILQDNARELERIKALVGGMKEGDYAKLLPNGWTITQALAHLAFWDLSQVARLERYIQKGVKPVSLDFEAINEPLAKVAEGLPPAAAAELVVDAAEAADRVVEMLTQAQFDELVGSGLERNLHRAQHRRAHLPKIEEALK